MLALWASENGENDRLHMDTGGTGLFPTPEYSNLKYERLFTVLPLAGCVPVVYNMIERNKSAFNIFKIRIKVGLD